MVFDGRLVQGRVACGENKQDTAVNDLERTQLTQYELIKSKTDQEAVRILLGDNMEHR